MRHITALVTLAILVAGCASTDPKVRNSPAFREGYEDGCAAATNRGADLRDRPVGDRELYASNDVYRAGYGSGLSTCRRSDLDAVATPGAGPITLPGPGH